MEKEDLKLFNNLKTKIKGIELIDKDNFILCLIHFNNQDNSTKFYYLLSKYEYDFILRENLNYNFDLCVHFKDIDNVLISDAPRNRVNYKPLRNLLKYSLPLKITTGINLDNGSYLEIGEHLDVKNLLLTKNKTRLN